MFTGINKTFRFEIWLPILSLMIGCASAPQPDLKKPKKFKSVTCEDTKKRGKSSDPVGITDKFLKGEGRRVVLFTQFFDLIPSGKYLMRTEWYRPGGEIEGSWAGQINPSNSHWKYWSYIKLDPRYMRESGLWVVQLYVNDDLTVERKFIIAEDERELTELVAKLEKEKPEAIMPQQRETETRVISSASVRQKWAVIIGISEYQFAGQNGLENLVFADDDAKAFAKVLENLGWRESHVKLLVNSEATQRKIMVALESWLTKAGPDDQIVLFWAGHGFADPEDPEKVYFACYDTNLSIPPMGYRMDRIRSALEERETKNVLIFADTCHAGKLITRGDRGVSVVPGIDKMRREEKVPKGWIFMVGADTDRKAIEHTSWTNGAFTHCLIKGLSGDADGYESVDRKDGIVTMRELRAFLSTAMPYETQKVLGIAKRPIMTTSSGDSDIWDITLQSK